MNECPSACHECVVVRVWIFAPMSVDVTCSMRTMGPFCARKQERTRTGRLLNAHGRLLSVHLPCRLAQGRTVEPRASPCGASASRPDRLLKCQVLQVFDQKNESRPEKISP